MEITFISSLTPQDERRLAAALMATMGNMLDLLPIAYSIRIRTASGKVLNRTHAPVDLDASAADALGSAVSKFHTGNEGQTAIV